MAVATIEDVATSLGRPVPDSGSVEAKQWEMWLADAELQVRLRFDGLEQLDQAVLAMVEREAVVLKVRKPDEATQVDIQVDDARTMRSYKRSTGQVTILPEWWDLLASTLDEAWSGAFSVRPCFEPDGPRWPSWVINAPEYP